MKYIFILSAVAIAWAAPLRAQTPYNPDADENHSITAYDLTSLLSVYGLPFSSAFLSDGAILLENQGGCCPEYFVPPYETEATTFVFDGNLVTGNPWDFVIAFQDLELVNGMTLVLILADEQDYLQLQRDVFDEETGSWSSETRTFHLPVPPTDFQEGPGVGYYSYDQPFLRILTMVWWNENWYLRQ